MLYYVYEGVENNEPVYWSNKGGWVDLESATLFSWSEITSLRSPLGTLCVTEVANELPRRVVGVTTHVASDGRRTGWRDISTFDKSKMALVLVCQDGAVRLRLWNPRGYWEHTNPPGSIVQGQECWNPTHWQPCPDAYEP
jgi:hypothetical protein